MRMSNIVDILSAIDKLDVEKLSSLAKKGVDLNWTHPDDGNNPFLVALKNWGGKISEIPFKEKTNEEQIAELEEIEKKATAIISIFLENAADVNCENIEGCTPLGCVKYYLYLGMLSFLPSAMSGKADEKKDVAQALSKFCYDIASILIDAGADENRKNRLGETPQEYADRIMSEEINIPRRKHRGMLFS